MNRRGLCVVAVLLVGGCATAESRVYSKPGVTAEQRERDKSDCLLDARVTTAGPEGPRMTVNQDRYHRCMANRGYTLDKVAQ